MVFDSEDETLSTISSSVCGGTVDPRVAEKFANLSQVLTETNQNLQDFEHLLNKYKKQKSPRSYSNANNQEDVVGILSHLQDMMKKISDNQSSPRSNGPMSDRGDCTTPTPKLQDYSSSRISELESAIRLKDDKISDLELRLSKESSAICDDRKSAAVLELKLGNEMENSGKLSRQIKVLEEQVKKYEKEKFKWKSERKIMKTDLEKEIREKVKLENRIREAEIQHREYETQLADLKKGLEIVQNELEECKTVTPRNELLPEIINNYEETIKIEKNRNGELQSAHDANQEKLLKLREKTKVLLEQYKHKKKSLAHKDKKLNYMKTSLGELRQLCGNSESNYRAILFHLGGQIEIAARLLAAYLNVDYNRNLVIPPPNNSTIRLTDWFCEVQALSLWIREQLVAFGVRYWTGKEDPELNKKILPLLNFNPEQELDDQKTILDAVTQVSDVYSSKINRIIAEDVTPEDPQPSNDEAVQGINESEELLFI